MSGGHFDYQQNRLLYIAEDLEDELSLNNYGYSDATLDYFRETVIALRRTYEMVRRIDWLLSGDDSEESFHVRWKEKVDYGDAK